MNIKRSYVSVEKKSGIGIITIVEVVFAILINFTDLISRPNGAFVGWLYDCLEGWSAIPFILFGGLLIVIPIILIIFLFYILFGLIAIKK